MRKVKTEAGAGNFSRLCLRVSPQSLWLGFYFGGVLGEPDFGGVSAGMIGRQSDEFLVGVVGVVDVSKSVLVDHPHLQPGIGVGILEAGDLLELDNGLVGMIGFVESQGEIVTCFPGIGLESQGVLKGQERGGVFAGAVAGQTQVEIGFEPGWILLNRLAVILNGGGEIFLLMSAEGSLEKEVGLFAVARCGGLRVLVGVRLVDADSYRGGFFAGSLFDGFGFRGDIYRGDGDGRRFRAGRRSG